MAMQKVWLRITALTGDTAVDVDRHPDRVLVSGRAFIRPNVQATYVEKMEYSDGYTELVIPVGVSCEIVNGYLTRDGQPYVWLPVSEEGWNWRIDFMDLRVRDEARQIESFNFDLDPATPTEIANAELPTNDPDYYRGKNLADLKQFTDPQTGTPAVQGPRGFTWVDVQLDGDDLVFVLGDPTNTEFQVGPVPQLTAASQAVEDAEQARDDAQGHATASDTARGLAVTAKNSSEAAAVASMGYATAADTARGLAVVAKDSAETALASFAVNVVANTLPPGSSATAVMSGGPPGSWLITLGIPEGEEGEMGPAGTSPNATAVVAGILMLTGVLSGTYDNPSIGSKKITTAMIADDAIKALQIEAGAVGTEEIANNAVGAGQLANGAVGATQLATDAVQTAKILNGNVTGPKIANDAIGSAHISTGAVGADEIAGTAITNAHISASAAIAAAKTLVPASFPLIAIGGARATGAGDLTGGIPIHDDLIIDELIYWFGTADGGGSTVCKIKRNRAGTVVDVVGSSKTIAVADQGIGSATVANRRTGQLSDATRVFQAGDLLVPDITVGTGTPGNLWGIYVKAKWG